MPEEQAFAVLVKIMYEPEYGLREMFMNKFIELHVKFYQLERLIEVIQLVFLLFQTYIMILKSLVAIYSRDGKFGG